MSTFTKEHFDNEVLTERLGELAAESDDFVRGVRWAYYTYNGIINQGLEEFSDFLFDSVTEAERQVAEDISTILESRLLAPTSERTMRLYQLVVDLVGDEEGAAASRAMQDEIDALLESLLDQLGIDSDNPFDYLIDDAA